MTEAGLLSIMRHGHTYQIRYASSNPYDMDRPPYLCPDEGAVRQFGGGTAENQLAVRSTPAKLAGCVGPLQGSYTGVELAAHVLRTVLRRACPLFTAPTLPGRDQPHRFVSTHAAHRAGGVHRPKDHTSTS